MGITVFAINIVTFAFVNVISCFHYCYDYFDNHEHTHTGTGVPRVRDI